MKSTGHWGKIIIVMLMPVHRIASYLDICLFELLYGFSVTGSSCTTSGFGTTYVTSGEYQRSRFIETRIGIKRGA